MDNRRGVLSILAASVVFLLLVQVALAQPCGGRVVTTDLGAMGRGSKMFRCGLVHSSGDVYIGTYGPAPAFIWKYDPRGQTLHKVAETDEYQLDCMVEAPDGIIYIGTAYNALVYRLEPVTGVVTLLGSPNLASTPWIFAMIRTRAGRIFGAKGVGIFELDWERGQLAPVGLVPGPHSTLGINASQPIVRTLVEGPDGVIWGDTNRWLFRFDPDNYDIEPVADLTRYEPAIYGMRLAQTMPQTDCYFTVISRFGDVPMKHPLYVARRGREQVEPVPLECWTGTAKAVEWWRAPEGWRLLMLTLQNDGWSRLAVFHPEKGSIEEWWDFDQRIDFAVRLPGSDRFYMNISPGRLFYAEPQRKRLKTLVENPYPAQSRCLASSSQRVLGTDTYDCGRVFTMDLLTGTTEDQGRVWQDDHRCNYGPAAFAGQDGRYFIANHGEQVQGLWVTDTRDDLHWRIGTTAVQLVSLSDGTIWGTTGTNPPTYKFDPNKAWVSSWQRLPGRLFQYLPGAAEVDYVEGYPSVGAIAAGPGEGRILITSATHIKVLQCDTKAVCHSRVLPTEIIAAAANRTRSIVYLLTDDGVLYSLCARGDKYLLELLQRDFALLDEIQRGFFVLPTSERVVALTASGTVKVYDPSKRHVTTYDGPEPLPAGPAVDAEEDAWYCADETVLKYSLPN